MYFEAFVLFCKLKNFSIDADKYICLWLTISFLHIILLFNAVCCIPPSGMSNIYFSFLILLLRCVVRRDHSFIKLSFQSIIGTIMMALLLQLCYFFKFYFFLHKYCYHFCYTQTLSCSFSLSLIGNIV